ncbi:polyprenyl synthetase family protein [Sphingomonas daechungensis]|uniref:polyprenyl synthetase family protein n=1 Tax=Sphingomonas daechungensis TaxID=1176646 RepID=UPI0031E8A941
MSTAEVARDFTHIDQPLARIAADIDAMFEEVLVQPSDPSARLLNAMRHAAIGGGKRLRPLLACASADLFDVPRSLSLRAGLAVECIHVHSLIHDDLPCMDDDDLRRGKPTVHVAFDEATAVLAGDSLLALAFEILSDPATHPLAEVRVELVRDLAHAAGAFGMAGGQMLDLLPAYQPADMEAVARLQRLKTGALIGWSVECGAVLGRAGAEERLSLRGYAQNLGLAFQIADDLLDVTGDPSAVGKRLRKDGDQGKETFVTLLGADRARRQAEMLVDQAIEHLHPFAASAELLIAIARFSISRDR